MTAPAILWFRQDLRLSDHAALAAAAAAGPVLPVYVLDGETPGQWRCGGASRWWLHHSLKSIGARAPLVLRRGRADAVLEVLAVETGASAIYCTRDYAPWSPALERRVKEMTARRGMGCHRYGGSLLHEPEAIRSGSGEPYKVYTPFSRACFAEGDPKPERTMPAIAWWNGSVASDALEDWHLTPAKPDWAAGFHEHWTPGEAGAQRMLQQFLSERLQEYAEHRDRPDLGRISRLSAHLHWGEVSPVQVWRAARHAMDEARGRLDGAGEKFLKELLWREFSYHLIARWPDLPEKPFRPDFAAFPWRDDPAGLSAWQRGLTGYPIVDAGMRELWATGFMHNRVRMIVASFLIKHLLIHWREGEAWFWDTLVDADIANNAASWQWVAGSGADAAPYFRIFNPVLQGENFDPEGSYVRRWVPELAALPNDAVHKPWTLAAPPHGYPAPLVEHGFARDRALKAFKKLGSATT